MIQKIEAIYTNGVLRPRQKLDLREQELVRLTIEQIEPASTAERERALDEFAEGVRHMNFRSIGSYPTRDELHERS